MQSRAGYSQETSTEAAAEARSISEEQLKRAMIRTIVGITAYFAIKRAVCAGVVKGNLKTFEMLTRAKL